MAFRSAVLATQGLRTVLCDATSDATVHATCAVRFKSLTQTLSAAPAGTRAVEARAPGYECGRDEVAYDAALKDVDIVAKEEGGGRGGSPDYEDELEEEEDVEEQDEADDDSDASDGMSVDLEDAVAHRKGGFRL